MSSGAAGSNSLDGGELPRRLNGALDRRADRLKRRWHQVLTSASAFDLTEFREYLVVKATSPAEIDQVLMLRRKKYGDRAAIEPEDLAPNAELFVTYAPDGLAIASIRFAFDLSGSGSLKAHKLTQIPQEWALRQDGTPARLSEGIRLCNAGRTKKEQLYAKLSLWFKVYWRCQDLGIDWSLALARPPINTDYRQMSYRPPSTGSLWITPFDYPEPHEMLALKVDDKTASWNDPSHWMYVAIHDRPRIHQRPQG